MMADKIAIGALLCLYAKVSNQTSPHPGSLHMQNLVSSGKLTD